MPSKKSTTASKRKTDARARATSKAKAAPKKRGKARRSKSTAAPRGPTRTKASAPSAKAATKGKLIPFAGRKLSKALKTVEGNVALNKVYQELRREIAKAVRGDALARYRIGARVLEIEKTPKKYGTSAADTLATLLSLDRSTLSLYKSVAETWKEGQVANLLKKQTAGGMPLTFSHLVALAAVEDSDVRQRFLDLALHEGLSVRMLRNKINGTDDGDDEGDEHAKELKPLRSAASHFEAEIKQVESRTETILKHAKEMKATAAVKKWLAACAEHQRALAEKASACADKIEKAHNELAEARASRHS